MRFAWWPKALKSPARKIMRMSRAIRPKTYDRAASDHFHIGFCEGFAMWPKNDSKICFAKKKLRLDPPGPGILKTSIKHISE